MCGIENRLTGEPCVVDWPSEIEEASDGEFLEKDRLAKAVVDQWCTFQAALTGARRKYPTESFVVSQTLLDAISKLPSRRC